MKPQRVFAAIAATLAFTAAAIAQEPTPRPLPESGAEAIAKATPIAATVAAIDMNNRIVTLERPEGNEFTVMVDPKVSDLDHVRVGDTVDVTYVQSVTLEFQKGDGVPAAMMTDPDGTSEVAGAPTPIDLMTDIWALDPVKGTALVRAPYGQYMELKLTNPTLLAGVKVGDKMKVTFMQATATALVRKP